MDRKTFANPGSAFRGVALWMLNDKLELDEIERQLREFRDAGWGAVITRTFMGLRTEYLSEEWMKILEKVISVSKELDLKVWFQAGYMPSGIPDMDTQHAHKVLFARKKDEEPKEDESVLCEDGRYVYAQRTLGTVLDLLSPEAARYYLEGAYDKTWGERFGGDFGKGIESVWVDEPHFRPPNLPWNDQLPGIFEKSWGYSILDHLPSLFLREGDFMKVRHHYWRTTTEMFINAYFVEVSKWCDAHDVKFSGHLMGEDSLLSQVAWTGSTMPQYEYMHLPGVDHLTLSLTWWHGRQDGFGGEKFIMTPKQCSSASNQFGKKEVLAEMYGVSTQGITFEDRKWIGEWFALLGINYRCYHGAFYSMRGRRKRIYAPNLSYQQPWWRDNRHVSDYFARLSYALRQGTFHADAMVLHPVESAYCAFEPLSYIPYKHHEVPAEIEEMNTCFARLSENLMKAHVSFEYGDEDILARHGKVTEQGLVVGEMTYRTLVMPSMLTLRETTRNLLEQFAARGGAILSVGDFPSRLDGSESADAGALHEKVVSVANEADALRAAMAKAAPPGIEIHAQEGDSRSVWIHERKVDGGRLVFLANSNRADSIKTEVTFQGKGAVEAWDLKSGEVRAITQRTEGKNTIVPLTFPPVGSHLLLQRTADAETAPAVTAKSKKVRTVDLSKTFQVRRDDPNAVTLDCCRLKKGDGAFSEPLPVIGIQQMLTETDDGYKGPITLQFHFECEFQPESIQIVVEDAAEFEIRVNGKTVKPEGLPYYLDRSFHPVDIGQHVIQGENQIELSRTFEPLQKPKFGLASLFQNLSGVELENIYLIGDFAVKGKHSSGADRPKCVRFSPGFVLTEEALQSEGDLLADGYPFFAGRLSLIQNIDLEAPAAGEEVRLSLPLLHAVLAKVRVNGVEAGATAWQPFEVDITKQVHGGENQIEIELVNSLRNLHGPLHRSQGEPDSCWGENDYSGAYCAQTGKSFPKWYLNREKDTDAWTEDYFFVPFGLGEGTRIDYLQ